MKKKIIGIMLLSILVVSWIIYSAIAYVELLLVFIFIMLNKLAKRSVWWKSKFSNYNSFMPQPIFRADYRRNFEMISLGSIESFYDFNYSNVYGLNLSTGLQSFNVDKKIIRFYHSYLRKGGLIAIPISPYYYKYKEDFRYYSRLFIDLSAEDKAKYGDYFNKHIPLLDYSDYPNLKLVNLYHKYPILFDLCGFIKYFCLRGGGGI